MEYAIINISGRQEKVSNGELLFVNHIDKKRGETIEFPVSFYSDGKSVMVKNIDKIKVNAKVLGDARGPKLEILKYKNKSRHHVLTGHRQGLTALEIIDIKKG